jgi:hypothetical protein
MSNSKKKREEARQRAKQRLQARKRRRLQSALVDASFVKTDVLREIRYITERAQAEDARLVSIANLVLFSTTTRDAWLLDSEDNFALCVCRDGEPQPYQIIDTPETFSIQWPARFSIEGEEFIVQEQSGRVVTILGYPTDEISAACGG